MIIGLTFGILHAINGNAFGILTAVTAFICGLVTVLTNQRSEGMKFKIISCAVYWLILYVVALVSARDIDDEKILGVTKSQWEAVILMGTMSLVVFAK